jgi:hypothetical protein
LDDILSGIKTNIAKLGTVRADEIRRRPRNHQSLRLPLQLLPIQANSTVLSPLSQAKRIQIIILESNSQAMTPQLMKTASLKAIHGRPSRLHFQLRIK